jgi:hypothetical protein
MKVAEADLDGIAETHNNCPQCHQQVIPPEWYDQAYDTIATFEEQLEQQAQQPIDAATPPEQPTLTPLENLELSTPQFVEDVKKFVAAHKADRKAAIALGKLVSKEAKEFKKLTEGAVSMLKIQQNQQKKKLMESQQYKTYRTQAGKAARLQTLLENRYDLGHRELSRYLRKKYKIFGLRSRWWGGPSWRIRRAFRIRL